MIYKKINTFVHLILEPMNRQKTEMEIVLTSGGSWFEEKRDRGRRHLLEHCIVSRTKSMDFNQLKDYSFRENIYLNAYTSRLRMGLEGSCHHTDFKKLTDLMIEFAFAPTLSDEDLDREKEIVLREISERTGDPNYQLHFDTLRSVYTPDSLKVHEVLGDREMVEKTTVEDFIRLYEQAQSQSHIIITVAGGGIDPEYIKHKIEERLEEGNNFLTQLRRTETKNPINYEAPSTFKKFDVLPFVHPYGHEHVELTFFIPITIEFDNRPQRNIFLNLFTSYDGRLYDRLRNELGLIYSMHGQFDAFINQFVISLSCELKHAKTIINETKDIFSDYSTHFQKTKFEEYKSIVKKKADIGLDTIGTTVEHFKAQLENYNREETYEEYISKLDSVIEEDMKELYDSITKGLSSMKIVGVSKNGSLSDYL